MASKKILSLVIFLVAFLNYGYSAPLNDFSDFQLIANQLARNKTNLVLADSSGFELIILHNNDMHGRFEQTSVNSNKCKPNDEANKKCYGGFARTAHEIRRIREEAKKPGATPVLYLNAGDTYTGTAWFSIFKDKIATKFLNILQPDAVCLGNHEFDEGVAGLVPFLNSVNFPVVAANLDLSKTPDLLAAKSLQKSIILNVERHKIGIIGYLTPDTKNFSSPNDVEYYPEIDAINKEAKLLKKDGVNIIIALGHSGYMEDIKIAQNCPDINIVIGGHSNTFLYSGKQPDAEIPVDEYPKVVVQSSGKKVLVVQAYAYTKYLGYLKLQFDKDENLLGWSGNPILLDSSVPQDQDILDVLEIFRPNITAIEQNIAGETRVFLDGTKLSCRKGECNLGNLIADSMILARVKELPDGTTEGYWTDAAIAIVNSGGLRTSIDLHSDGLITHNDLLAVVPFHNNLYIAEITGQTIRNALELSAQKFDLNESNGGFLQMSGIQVTYDMNRAIGERVIKILVRCAACSVPHYIELNNSEKYKVIMPSFLLRGGDGHTFSNSPNPLENALKLELNDFAAAYDYVKSRSPLYIGTQGRIIIHTEPVATAAFTGGSLKTATLNVSLVLSSLLISLKYWL